MTVSFPWGSPQSTQQDLKILRALDKLPPYNGCSEKQIGYIGQIQDPDARDMALRDLCCEILRGYHPKKAQETASQIRNPTLQTSALWSIFKYALETKDFGLALRIANQIPKDPEKNRALTLRYWNIVPTLIEEDCLSQAKEYKTLISVEIVLDHENFREIPQASQTKIFTTFAQIDMQPQAILALNKILTPVQLLIVLQNATRDLIRKKQFDLARQTADYMITDPVRQYQYAAEIYHHSLNEIAQARGVKNVGKNPSV